MDGKSITLLADTVASYVKACGKRSILQTRPQNLKGINLSELKFAPNAEHDVVEIGYSRLKGVFTTGQNYKNYEQIVSSAKNKIVGNIPKELIDIILKNHPEKKAELIKRMQYAFGDTAETLKLIQEAEIKAVNSLKGAESEKAFLLWDDLSANSISLIDKAKEGLHASLKDILPQGSQVEIKYIGSGSFGDAYKLALTDSAGEKIMHDRVIKVYKDQTLFKELRIARGKKAEELFAKYTDEELYQMYQTRPEPPSKGFVIKMDPFKRFQNKLQARKNDLLKYTEENAVYNQERNISLFDTHGANAEANSTIRLKYLLGHDISKTNAVDTDMFDLGRGYSLAQFSDTMLPKQKSKIDFTKLGLQADDLEKSDNFVNGRIIDFGGLLTTEPIFQDKTVVKYYKKIMNRENLQERQALINRYKELVKNPKTPERDKIHQVLCYIDPIYRLLGI